SVYFFKSILRILSREEYMVGPEFEGLVQPVFINISCNYGSPSKLCQLYMQKSGNTGTYYQNSMCSLKLELLLSEHNACKGLNHSSLFILHLPGQQERSIFHISHRHTYIFRKSARLIISRVQCLTCSKVAFIAVTAAVAWYMMRYKDPLACLQFLYALACFNDLSGHLMAQDTRRFFLPVPLHYVGAADAGRHHPDQYLACGYARYRTFLQSHITVAVVNRHFHKLTGKRPFYTFSISAFMLSDVADFLLP